MMKLDKTQQLKELAKKTENEKLAKSINIKLKDINSDKPIEK